MRAISRILTAEGVPTPKRGYKIGRGRWGHTIHSIIDRPTCIGVFQFGGVTINLPELAIIDRATFEAAHKRREKNIALSKRNRKFPFLFSGYAYCVCGGRMNGGSLGKGAGKRYYYACNRRANYDYLVDCRERFIRVEVFEPLVWN